MDTPSLPASNTKRHAHIMPFGCQILQEGGVLFRLWAPSACRVDLCLEDNKGGQEFYPMDQRPGGWFEGTVSSARVGCLYRFRIDANLLVPDPVSRGQWAGSHGPSIVVDPTDFVWNDDAWQGRPWEEAVFYEIHPGTFSPAGTFAGISKQLPYLADLGITAIELMPIAHFPGDRNWGYDGTLLFAPNTTYGSPNDLKQLINAAHAHKIMVFLDVVYNHFGPEGNYLYAYAKEAFFTEQHHTPWGAALNFAGKNNRTVRDYFIHNALYWLEEYRFDGLRFDAVHMIFDESCPDILEEIATVVQNGPGKTRQIHLVLENDANKVRYLSRNHDGSPSHFVAQWNDDVHHACHVLLTGEQTGCYIDYADKPIHHLGRCLTEGFAYQGEPSTYRNQCYRGEKSDHLPPQAFVFFLQNHDQVGNRPSGERLSSLVPESVLRIASALMLLCPNPPLLFMGEEFGAITPFLFFCDFDPGLAGQITAGRRRELGQFSEFSDPAAWDSIPDPEDIETYHRSRLNWQELESERGARFFKLHKTLLALRRKEIFPRLAGMKGGQAQYQVLGPKALQASWLLADDSLLQVAVNFDSTKPAATALPPTGTMLYSDPSQESGGRNQQVIEPQSIVWFLEN